MGDLQGKLQNRSMVGDRMKIPEKPGKNRRVYRCETIWLANKKWTILIIG